MKQKMARNFKRICQAAEREKKQERAKGDIVMKVKKERKQLMKKKD